MSLSQRVYSVIFIAVWCSSIVTGSALTQDTAADSRPQLHLLALVPLGNLAANESVPCVDRGEELIAAAEIAADTINNNNDILADFQLRVVPANINRCTGNSNADSLISFANYSGKVVADSINMVGVIGMVCSSTLLAITPLASQEEVNIVQITSGTTPPSISEARNYQISQLYQTAPHATIYNDAVIALMRQQGWNNISVIKLVDTVIRRYDTIAADFIKKIDKSSDLSISFNGEIHNLDILDAIISSGVRIIYATLPTHLARNLLCEGHKRRLMWPSYAWILHDNSLEELSKATAECSAETMRMALRGVILLYYSPIEDHSKVLDSGETYQQYFDKYSRCLERLESRNSTETCATRHGIVYPNSMYDSVLAFALALNSSLSSGEITAQELQQYGLGSSLTTAINRSLESVNFNGAGGNIYFDKVSHETNFTINVSICQVNPMGGGNLVHSAMYNSTSGGIVEMVKINSIQDEFERLTIRIPLPLPIVTFVIAILAIVANTIVMMLFIYYWNSPDIKATSPTLSFVILIACYLLYISVILDAVQYGFSEGQSFADLCLATSWFFLVGVLMIFATLFWRLARVYRIFFNYTKLGTEWSDPALLVYIFLMVFAMIVLLTFWTAFDRPVTREDLTFVATTNPPHNEVFISCHSKHNEVREALTVGYIGLIILLVVILAVMTRKVKIESFKDTRTVNVFIFTTVLVLLLFLPLSLILLFTGTQVALTVSYCFDVLSLLLVPIACKVFLFAPKIYFARFPNELRQKSTTTANATMNATQSAPMSPNPRVSLTGENAEIIKIKKQRP